MLNRALPENSYADRRLGHVLIESGKLNNEQLAEALTLQRQRGRKLGELLCQLGHVDALAVREALIEQAGIPRVDPATIEATSEAISAVPADVAFRHKALPVSTHNRTLLVAMADPFDRVAIESLRVLTGRRIERHYCPEAELLEAARRAYGSSVARMIADLDVGAADVDATDEQLAHQLEEMAQEPTVVNLVNLIIAEAIEARASDIHVEPFEQALRVKYRIDGVLHEVSPPPKKLQPAIVSRLKIMAGMNIAERFIPQDGHITISGPAGKVDLRVATVPTVFGECVAMRILDRAAAMIEMDRLGLNETCLHGIDSLLARPHGVVLVTGPTGSGKTTTLYAALNKLYTTEKKIITIEDPVEYQLDGVNQIPVNRKRGLDFAGGLRAIVRQDPDIIMIGEIRDRETADIAIRSALTGHLVFSTLHTNDAAGAVTRLIDMGIEPYLLASSLEGVLAQRLVRTICPHCKEPYQPDAEALWRIGNGAGDADRTPFYHGPGCRHCRQTGYSGRTGIYELLRITPAVRQAITARATAAEVAAIAPSDHQPMREDGFAKAAAGVTTVDEVLRVTQDTLTEEARSG